MIWRVHYFDPQSNREGVSRAFASKEDALRQACYLMRKNCGRDSSPAPTTKKSTLSRLLDGAKSIRYAGTRCRNLFREIQFKSTIVLGCRDGFAS